MVQKLKALATAEVVVDAPSSIIASEVALLCPTIATLIAANIACAAALSEPVSRDS